MGGRREYENWRQPHLLSNRILESFVLLSVRLSFSKQKTAERRSFV